MGCIGELLFRGACMTSCGRSFFWAPVPHSGRIYGGSSNMTLFTLSMPLGMFPYGH